MEVFIQALGMVENLWMWVELLKEKKKVKFSGQRGGNGENCWISERYEVPFGCSTICSWAKHHSPDAVKLFNSFWMALHAVEDFSRRNFSVLELVDFPTHYVMPNSLCHVKLAGIEKSPTQKRANSFGRSETFSSSTSSSSGLRFMCESVSGRAPNISFPFS